MRGSSTSRNRGREHPRERAPDLLGDLAHRPPGRTQGGDPRPRGGKGRVGGGGQRRTARPWRCPASRAPGAGDAGTGQRSGAAGRVACRGGFQTRPYRQGGLHVGAGFKPAPTDRAGCTSGRVSNPSLPTGRVACRGGFQTRLYRQGGLHVGAGFKPAPTDRAGCTSRRVSNPFLPTGRIACRGGFQTRLYSEMFSGSSAHRAGLFAM
jgi:hypothetical protein